MASQTMDGLWTDRACCTLHVACCLLLVVVDNLNATFRYKISVKAAHKSSGKITRGCHKTTAEAGGVAGDEEETDSGTLQLEIVILQ